MWLMTAHANALYCLAHLHQAESRRKKRRERGMYHTSLVGKNIQSPMGINAISALFKRLGAATC